ncbi:uncharacterized protein ACLA_009970 [Aspergillus clavatus NRRL 1]|uniref:Ribonucleases P/MRP subunit Pop8-like domain-containing protein n=1 Tax=Aspergillus clavatus (strain ATCC 1007 / CBS 513.65 / DSM 816 / NCTC 3887 / NRRL 1 / QM 1276 / 107) TaxID=344612 RepID=A1CA06_ASPCL|nr:uncharacterized protein ACLA_009970 [Aspergillus clavatus NRRL 1]EAW12574.1 conserved hypothetical protein [Aspergillus clavatus NRRL 1]
MTSITSQPTPTPTQPNPSTTTPSKRKSPNETNTSNPSAKVLHFTSRNPAWTYLKLQLITHPSSTTTPLDPLTAKTHLTAALSQFLGLTGTAIPLDILKTAPATSHAQTVWVRVPRPDAPAVVAALSSWIGGAQGSAAQAGGVAWRVCARGNYLGAVVRGSGAELFVP